MRRRALGSFLRLEERLLLSAAPSPAALSSGDAAGENWREALDLGAVDNSADKTVEVRGTAGGVDYSDWFRFSLDDDAAFSAQLALEANLDLYLFEKTERSWRLRDSSTASGPSAEQVEANLSAGDYFLLVLSRSSEAGQYELTLAAPQSSNDSAPLVSPPASSRTFNSSTGYGLASARRAVATALGAAAIPQAAPLAGADSWNLNALGAADAWARGVTGEGVLVAVIDTGVDDAHPEFRGRLFTNPGEIAGDHRDNDGNGYIDDVRGWDFASGDNDPRDENGHGTHVASIVAAARDGAGVTGVAPAAKILPVRVLGADGSGSNADVAKGIRYAADLGADVINLSLAGGPSEAVRAAIDYASARGAVVVIAAGNDGASAPSYPAQYAASNGIAVGAVDASGNLASFSNRAGSKPLDYVTAPGVRVLGADLGGGYVRMSGTSMAAPHVAGIAALVVSANPALSAAEVEQILIGARQPTSWVQAVDATFAGVMA